MKLKEVLDKTTTFFKQKNFESPRLDAEILLSFGLNLERIQLYLNFDQPLKELELEKLRVLVKRRSLGEPISQIIGIKEFYKGSFFVNSSVLTPRPETETLVENAMEYLETVPSPVVLDLGSGTGCIGLSLAREVEGAKVFMIEKSPDAFQVLKKNSEQFASENLNIELILGDAEDSQSFGFKEEMFDLIVSNPPYIDFEDLEICENVKKFEPSMALFAKNKGMEFILSWAEKYKNFLKPQGVIIFEMGYTQGQALKNEFENKLNYSSIKIIKDLSGKDRFIKAVR